MPKGTKVHRCVQDVKKQGHDEGSAIAICQSSTGQSFQSGKKTRKSDGKRVGSESVIAHRVQRALDLLEQSLKVS